jgi:hypothetical protein
VEARWRLAQRRLNQTGKLSVREVYHDHENYAHDCDFDDSFIQYGIF